MSKDTGGPAFPAFQSGIQGKACNTKFDPIGGMALRDYFAAAALANMRVHENSDNPLYWERISAACFIAANAMLTERAKDGES